MVDRLAGNEYERLRYTALGSRWSRNSEQPWAQAGKVSIAMAVHVVLIAPEIHWNTGNCGRTCLATGSRLHLVEPLGFSLAAREVRRAGLDYWPRVLPCLWPDWDSLEEELETLGDPWFFSAEGKLQLWDMQPGENTVLIFGGERHGLPKQIRQRYADRLVRIPQQRDTVRSLNLSTAVAIGIYEILRARSGVTA